MAAGTAAKRVLSRSVGAAAVAFALAPASLLLEAPAVGGARLAGRAARLGAAVAEAQPRDEALPGQFQVLVLAAALGGGHRDAARGMMDADPGVGAVAVLPAGAAGDHETDHHLLLEDGSVGREALVGHGSGGGPAPTASLQSVPP